MNKPSLLVEGRTELYVPISTGEIVYVFPAFGPDNYRTVGKQIIRAGLQVPTGDEIAPFVRDLYLGANKDKEVIKNARSIFKNRWLWVFNQDLWTPEGFYSVLDRNANGLSERLEVEDLKQRLVGGSKYKGIEFSSNRQVRFAPIGSYTFGEMSAEELEEDGVLIARHDIEGAKSLAEVSDSFENRPINYGVNVKDGQNPVQRVSAVVEYDGWLDVGGGSFDYYGCGFAFPVSAPKADKRE